jgi:hypothetical protein
MFSGFLGKGKKKPDSAPTKDAVNSRGLEVVEDDPDTTWGLWESAVAEQDSRLSPLDVAQPRPDASGAFLLTVPLPIMEESGSASEPPDLLELTPEQRKDLALETIEQHYPRISKAIRSFWGYKECSQYIAKLIMEGGDSRGNARMGFNQDAAQALMVLSEIHDAQFGFGTGEAELGYADPRARSGFDRSRG